MKVLMIAAAMMLFMAVVARAEIVTKTVEYEQGGVKLEGKAVFDDASKAKRPGVLVVHQWMGPNDLQVTRG